MRGKTATGILFTVVLVVAVVVTLYAGLVEKDLQTRVPEPFVNFSADWQYVQQDGNLRTVNLPLKDNSLRGGVFTLHKKLPTQLPRDALLYLKNYHNDVAAFIEGKPLFVEGLYHDRTFGYHFNELWAVIALEEADAGKEITLTVTQKNSASGIQIGSLSIASYGSLMRQLVSEKLPVVFVIAVLGGISIVLLVLGAFSCYKKLDMPWYSFFYLAAFAFLAGLWLLLDSKLLSTLYGYSDIQYFLSFYSFMLMPVPFCFFLQELFPKRKWVFTVFAALLSCIPLLGTGLLVVGVIDSLFRVVFASHVLIVGIILLYFCLVFQQRRKKGAVGLLKFVAAILSFCVLSAVGLGLFYLGDERYSWVFSTGVMLFVVFVSLEMLPLFQRVAQQAGESESNRTLALQARNDLKVNQISTHFFYHILSATRVLTKTDPNAAYKMLGDISKYLRYKTDGPELAAGLVQFREEMRVVNAYVDLKKMILGERLHVRYELEVQDFILPMLTIQPLIENAIEHGIEKKREGGTVLLLVREEITFYEIRVEDDGCGFAVPPKGEAMGVSTGQKNIIERLERFHDCDMQVASAPGAGTQVLVRISKELGG